MSKKNSKDIVYEILKPINNDYDKFMKKYRKDHALCPKCKTKLHSSTLMGYILDLDHPEDYKDLNKCVCSNCGDIHTTHDRVKK